MSSNQGKNSVFLSGLNEIRGIAAIGVVIGHLGYGHSGMAGNMVNVFFVLSGFLISYLLLHEKQKSKDISISKFYMRRLLRIWPLYFLYLLLVIVITGDVDQTVWWYVFFSGNIALAYNISHVTLGHYWSLAVEEQFYVFWPWISKKAKNFALAMIGVLIVYNVIKTGIYVVYGSHHSLYTLIYLTKFNSMAIGGLAAYALFHNSKWLVIIRHPVTHMLAIIYAVTTMFGYTHLISFIDNDILSIASAIIFINQTSNHRPWLVLKSRVLDFLGKISFGIYVYHPLVIYLATEYFGVSHTATDWPEHVLILLATFGVSFLSYRYFEQYFMKLKNKFSVINSNKPSIHTHS